MGDPYAEISEKGRFVRPMVNRGQLGWSRSMHERFLIRFWREIGRFYGRIVDQFTTSGWTVNSKSEIEILI